MANFIKRNRNSIVKIIFAVLLGVIFYNTALPKIAALPFDYCDIGFRHNEISLVREGINPFYVWNHEMEHEKYCGLSRPDMPSNCNGKQEYVHFYPPWHFTLFWWYAYLPTVVCAGILLFVYLAILFFLLRYLSRWEPSAILDRVLFWEMLVVVILYPYLRVICVMNYSPLLLVAMFAFCYALKRDKQILLGIAWAILLIKPQVGGLFIFPLLFSHKWKIIVIALGICILATLWPAYVLHESPIDLILLIPKMGAPYLEASNLNFILVRKLVLWFGPTGRIVWMILCASACGTLCYLFRKSPSPWIQIAPVLVFYPIITYCSDHDFVLLCPLVVLFSLTLFDRGYFLASQKAKLILMALFLAQLLPHFLATYSPLQLFIATILFDYDSAYQLYNLVYLFCIKTFFPFLQVGCTASIVAYFVYRILKTKPEEINPPWNE